MQRGMHRGATLRAGTHPQSLGLDTTGAQGTGRMGGGGRQRGKPFRRSWRGSLLRGWKRRWAAHRRSQVTWRWRAPEVPGRRARLPGSTSVEGFALSPLTLECDRGSHEAAAEALSGQKSLDVSGGPHPPAPGSIPGLARL